jgi:hypothetical protein
VIKIIETFDLVPKLIETFDLVPKQTFDLVPKQTFDLVPKLLETFNLVKRSSAIRSSDHTPNWRVY